MLKKFFIYLSLLFSIILFSCHPDLIDPIENNINSLSAESEKFSNPNYQDITPPAEIINLCLNGNCVPLQMWLDAKTSKLERDCNSAKNCKEKLTLVDNLIYIQKQIDKFGLDDVVMLEALCDGFLDITNTYVEIIPSELELEIGDEVLLQSEIKVGESNCDGEIIWSSSDKDVAIVDQDGNVKAIGNGSTLIVAAVKDAQNIKGQINVTVGATDYDIVFVVETSSGAYWLAGFENVGDPGYYMGFRYLSNEIYESFDNHFIGSDSRIGLVGFSHYPIWPYGVTLQQCYDTGWNYPGFEPLIGMSVYQPRLTLTNNPNSIKAAIAGIQMMCTDADYQYDWQAANFSAIIKTIENMNWRENTNKVIILIGVFPATFDALVVPGGASVGYEGYSNYTINDVIQKANNEGVRVYTICGKLGITGTVYEVSRTEYLAIANGTGGEYYTGQTQLYDLLQAIDETLQSIKSNSLP